MPNRAEPFRAPEGCGASAGVTPIGPVAELAIAALFVIAHPEHVIRELLVGEAGWHRRHAEFVRGEAGDVPDGPLGETRAADNVPPMRIDEFLRFRTRMTCCRCALTNSGASQPGG